MWAKKTQKRNAAIIANAGTIIWSGPRRRFLKSRLSPVEQNL